MKCPGLSPSDVPRATARRESPAGLLVFAGGLLLGVVLAVRSRAPAPLEERIPPVAAFPERLPRVSEPCCPRPVEAKPAAPSRGNPDVTFRGDPGLAGVFAGEAPSAPVGIRWRMPTGGTPAGGLVWDGQRFLVALAEGSVIAVSPQGRELWRRGAALDGVAGPPVVTQGRCVVSSPSGTFAAFDATSGELLWRFTSAIDFNPRSAPVPAGDLLVAVSQPDGRLMALESASGTLRWTGAPLSRCDGPLSIAGGWILHGNCDAAIQIQDARSGDSVGSVPLGPDAQVAGGVAVHGDLACFGTRSGQVVLMDIPSRELRWSIDVGSGEIFSTPVLTDDRVFVTSANAEVVALGTQDGAQLWRHDTLQRSSTSPILVGGSVVVGASGIIMAFDARTGQPQWSLAVGDATTEPVAGNGLVVVGTDEGELVAIAGRDP